MASVTLQFVENVGALRYRPCRLQCGRRREEAHEISGHIDVAFAGRRVDLIFGIGELNNAATEVGFGMTGTGSTGATSFDGLKRAGQNTVDAMYRSADGGARILL